MFKTPSSKFKLDSSVDCGPTINSGLAKPLVDTKLHTRRGQSRMLALSYALYNNNLIMHIVY